jgi:hypothetical protein
MAVVLSPGVQMVEMLTESMRSGAGDLWERFLTGPQEQWGLTTQRIGDLLEQLDPFDMEAVQGDDGRTAVDYALWLVGLTREMEQITGALSLAQRRALLRSAVALWKKKGLPAGWVRWAGLLTASDAVYRDYFGWRYLTDEDYLGDGPVLLDPEDSPVYGAHHSDLYLVAEGADLREAMRLLVDMTRPSSERVRLRWVDWLEAWRRDLSGWQRSGGEVTLDAGSGQVALAAGARALYALYAAGYSVFRARMSVTSSASLCYHWADALHAVAFEVDLIAQEARLWWVNGGGWVLSASAALPALLVPGVWYAYEVTAGAVPGGVSGTLRIDGDAVLTGVFPAGLSAGMSGVWASGVDGVAVGECMGFLLPLEYSFAAPDGAWDEEA